LNVMGKENKITVPVSELRSGIYIITIHAEKENRSLKFVKE